MSAEGQVELLGRLPEPVAGADRLFLTGWQLAPSDPDADQPPEHGWVPVSGAGDVATSLMAAGRQCDDVDAVDWWYQLDRASLQQLTGPGELVLHLGGVTPPASVLVDGIEVARVDTMHLPVRVPLTGPAQVLVRCRSLQRTLATPRRPRARWRTKIAEPGLRFVRTALLGRAPGFAPGPPTVGLWRPAWVEVPGSVMVHQVQLCPSVRHDAATGGSGRLELSAVLSTRHSGGPERADLVLTGPTGTHRTQVRLTPTGATGRDQRVTGVVEVPDVALWWPATHGTPHLYRVHLQVGLQLLPLGRTGFRSLAAGPRPDHDVECDGIDLQVNGVPVFLRGAVWTRPGGITSRLPVREQVQRLAQAGMNMLRVPGTGAWEDDDLVDACDELGVLVWHDVPLASYDYPEADPEFCALVVDETRHHLRRWAGRPSLAVLCGGSEVEQQVAMLGLPAELARGRLTGELLPGLLAATGSDAVWVPASPCGGDLPFRPSVGIAHYFGVGGYRRPLSDVRRARVRFAAECLAIANLPAVGGDAGWVPRDVGADWDFADVRDHYLAELYGTTAAALAEDPARYRQLSQEVSGTVMAQVFGEWRRSGSPCGGGLVLWWADLRPGAGWGLVASDGQPKPALSVLARALAPTAVWTTDEGLDGVAVHVANDGPSDLGGRLEVASYRADGVRLHAGELALTVPGRGGWTGNLEQLLGRFVDASWAYRFGPPEAAVHVVTWRLATDGEGQVEASRECFHYPAGPPVSPIPADELGLTGELVRSPDGLAVRVRAQRPVHRVRVAVEGRLPVDDGFDLVPGVARLIGLRPASWEACQQTGIPAGEVRALTLSGAVALR